MAQSSHRGSPRGADARRPGVVWPQSRGGNGGGILSESQGNSEELERL
jgi:hypothetical protein